MSKKDLYRGADIVGKASEAKFTEVSEWLGEIREDWSKFSKYQNVVNKAVVNAVDNHDERLQSLEDSRNFIRISRHSLIDLESNEQELLAGWLQKLVLELGNRGFSLNTNQQEFLSNLFKLIGLHDVLVEQRGGLEKLQSIGDSEFHEAVYKVFLILCYLYDNNFNILSEVEDIDYLFNLSGAQKSKIRGLLENERIPALGTTGLVQMFEQGKPLESFSIDVLISRHISINSHTLLKLNLDKENYATYLKSFALLVPENGKVIEKQRNFLLALASLFGCKEIIFEVDKLCKSPQNVDVLAWQSLLDTNEKKYAWALDAAALLGLDPDFNLAEEQNIEEVLKGLKLFDKHDFLTAAVQLTRNSESTKLLNSIKIVYKYCHDWKHIIEYCGFSFKCAFDELMSTLNQYNVELLQLKFKSMGLRTQTFENRFSIDSYDDENIAMKFFSRIGDKATQISRASDVKDLLGFKKEIEDVFSRNKKITFKANKILRVFGVENIDSTYWYMADSEFELNNSVSNDDWGDDFDYLLDKLEKILDAETEVIILLMEQLELFEEGRLYESIVVKKQREQEERVKQKQAEKEARRKVIVGKKENRQIVSIAWRDLTNLPFRPDEISKIVSSESGWVIQVNDKELFTSKDGENWTSVKFPIKINYCRSIKNINDTWLILNDKDESYFSLDCKIWQKIVFPAKINSYKNEIIFLNGQWIFIGELECEYSYAETKKGFFWDSTTIETRCYDAPVFYRSESLHGPWEKWNHASTLAEGLVLATPSVGVHENLLIAAFEHDYFYRSNKGLRSQASDVLYINPKGTWESTTWPKDEIERCRGDFYHWQNKIFYVDGSSLLVSFNGYEWRVATKELSHGVSFMDICGLLLLPVEGGSTVFISDDGIKFSEMDLSKTDVEQWSDFAASNQSILAKFRPSNHETFLRLGSIQITKEV